MKTFPDFKFEIPLWEKGFTVMGIDEVGRGAFAGPVCVGGVAFPSNLNSSTKEYLSTLGINDSKKLTSKKRESLAGIIKEESLCHSISFIDVMTINKVGIGKATFMAMQTVAAEISSKIKNPYFLIDAFEIPRISKNIQRGIVRGDSLSISIAAASIIAKVERDRLMVELGSEFPNYGFEKHKGYGTLIHREAIKKFGQTEYHRKEFCRRVGIMKHES